MKRQASRPNVGAVLGGLKDFQRRTADYVFRRLYLDSDATRRFLIADEVGLGKTLVARGVIAQAIDYLWDKVERIDVVYICSNADIARQNINRLKIDDQEDFALASRITLLPSKICDLKANPLNFISFTPGTSFDLKSSLGTANERALIYWLLDRAWGIASAGTGPLHLLQGWMSTERFRDLVKNYSAEIDESLAQAYVDALKHQKGLRSRFEDLCKRFRYTRQHRPDADIIDRSIMVGELRTLLAATCLRALEPDLIILDEFQRFKYLLNGEDEASLLARELFNYSDEKTSARVLLLSATPYKPYTLSHEMADDDHYKDFCDTLRFLQSSEERTTQFTQLLAEYRRELFRLGSGGGEQLPAINRELQAQLRQVMVRTERLAVTEDRDGMLADAPNDTTKLEPQDLEAYVAVERAARLLDHDSVIEYWKSAPYLLNFMDDYKLKRDFKAAVESKDPAQCSELARALAGANNLLLPWRDVSRYEEVDPGNARLRSLLAETLGLGAWRLLWIPPAMPYYQLGGPFAEPPLQHFTKRLVFSSWRVVPKVIATLVSYEAERQMIRSFDKKAATTYEDRERRRPLLRFARTGGRLTGMPVLGLIYPCITLARECDPLTALTESSRKEDLPTAGDVLDRFRRQIEHLLSRTKVKQAESGPEDEAWYWAGPILLDLVAHDQATHDWFGRPNLAVIWSGKEDTQDDEGVETHWAAHVAQARELIDGGMTLGRRPADLSHVLAQMAVAGPGVAALRALSRIAGDSQAMLMPDVRDGAAQIAHSFVYLFNLPEAMGLLRGMNAEEPYWRRVLEYCVDGGLQPVLDEYAHVLRESLGLLNSTPGETAGAVTQTMCGALTLHTSRLGVDDVIVDPRSQKVKPLERRDMRARFALRFGDEKSDADQEVTHPDQVRAAFNSPFWPFVLATTSVGQEGLDFHLYCHAVVHWNLPSNPVDLEQREGRVHRYKGHAVRKNLALACGSLVRLGGYADPWETMFSLGKSFNRTPDSSDLVPFWVYPGRAKIERHVPALPLSRDAERLIALRRSLAVYRMVFGQNRQEDLLSYLLAHLPASEIARVAQDLRVDLSPPAGDAVVGK